MNEYLFAAKDLYEKALADKKNKREARDQMDKIDQLIESRRGLSIAEELLQENRHVAARQVIDDINFHSQYDNQVNKLRRLIRLATFEEETVTLFASGEGEQALKDIKDFGAGEYKALEELIEKTLSLLKGGRKHMDSMEFKLAEKKFLKILDSLDEENAYFKKAMAEINKLDDHAHLASLLIDDGNSKLNMKKFSEARVAFKKAMAYDEVSASKKLDYINELPSKYLKKANKQLKLRPLFAFYSLREAFLMVSDEQESLKKEIRLKMESAERILERENIVVENI
jgi:hypothetical protein